MKVLIDTNIAIHARDGFEPVLDKLARHEGVVFLSALSLAELQRGLYLGARLGVPAVPAENNPADRFRFSLSTRPRLKPTARSSPRSAERAAETSID